MTQLSKMIWFDWFTVLRAMTQNIASPYALEIISSPAYISERGVSFYTVRRALTGCAISTAREERERTRQPHVTKKEREMSQKDRIGKFRGKIILDPFY